MSNADYRIEDEGENAPTPLCTVCLYRNGEPVAWFTDEGRAREYVDWLTDPAHDDIIEKMRKREDSWGT
jgi:hypothetical protein